MFGDFFSGGYKCQRHDFQEQYPPPPEKRTHLLRHVKTIYVIVRPIRLQPKSREVRCVWGFG